MKAENGLMSQFRFVFLWFLFSFGLCEIVYTMILIQNLSHSLRVKAMNLVKTCVCHPYYGRMYSCWIWVRISIIQLISPHLLCTLRRGLIPRLSDRWQSGQHRQAEVCSANLTHCLWVYYVFINIVCVHTFGLQPWDCR